MRRKLATIAIGAGLLGLAGVGFAGIGDSEETITGPNAERAERAALRATGGGTVLGVERGDDGGSVYEVEIRTADGGVAEVLLGGDFDVLRTIRGDDD
jgi:hypothetical protein